MHPFTLPLTCIPRRHVPIPARHALLSNIERNAVLGLQLPCMRPARIRENGEDGGQHQEWKKSATIMEKRSIRCKKCLNDTPS
ncbi:hypothetical protein HBI56_023240 [Parastagonospora nodorum]|nr:hypothetical protein HBH53_084430 [Parastagonospora nodorum]KAH3975850.1 hypothetical protein HBH51_080920 [Parastagonospora nodorum]KAH4006324.1 hypothetical protein HBI10_027740 [Parastagonospora nodorum]KAH4023170.1 hypothetical protein HBI13_095350 [Parastagonospora nodorum]KAH4064911.1 hypothetical protein HBH50_168760 [Parastagonospora nodorum]